MSIEIYIQKSEKRPDQNFTFSDTFDTYVSVNDLYKQSKNFGIDCSITIGEPEDIPRKTKGNIFILLDEKTLIPNDYLARVASITNLHRNLSLAFGARIGRVSRGVLDSAILSVYEFRSIHHVDSLFSFSINGEVDNYPRATCCVFSSYAYNISGGYTRSILKNGSTDYNHRFMKSMDGIGPIIYHRALKTYEYIPSESLEEKNIQKLFYDLGYECKCKNMQHDVCKSILFKKDTDEHKYGLAFSMGYMENVET